MVIANLAGDKAANWAIVEPFYTGVSGGMSPKRFPELGMAFSAATAWFNKNKPKASRLLPSEVMQLTLGEFEQEFVDASEEDEQEEDTEEGWYSRPDSL